MTNPTSDWDKVPISACYRLIGGGYDSGTVSFTLSQRITTVDGSGLYARGQKITVSVSDSDGALSLNFPASDDPDVSPNGWTIKVEENLKSKGGQVYYITPTLEAGSVNLNTVVVPDDAPSAPPPVYARGQAGGLAGLDADGDVVNAAGDKVTGGDAATLSALSDVSTTGVTDGQALVYSTDDSKWKPGPGRVTEFADLTDVDTTDRADGKIVAWDADSSKNVYVAPPSGGGASSLDDLDNVDVSDATAGQVFGTSDGTNWGPVDISVDAGNVSGLADVATSGSYTDLDDKPTIPTTAAEISAVPSDVTVNGISYDSGTNTVTLTPAAIGAATSAQGTTADNAVQPGDLATVATSGALGDLTDVTTTGATAGQVIGTTDGSTWGPVDAGSGDVASVNGHTGTVSLDADDVGAVPTTRTINGKTLDDDVTLAAADVSAVPTTRTVNSKALSGDITLSAADVGAATSDQGTKADSAVQPADLATVATSGNYTDLAGLSDALSARAVVRTGALGIWPPSDTWPDSPTEGDVFFYTGGS